MKTHQPIAETVEPAAPVSTERGARQSNGYALRTYKVVDADGATLYVTVLIDGAFGNAVGIAQSLVDRGRLD